MFLRKVFSQFFIAKKSLPFIVTFNFSLLYLFTVLCTLYSLLYLFTVRTIWIMFDH